MSQLEFNREVQRFFDVAINETYFSSNNVNVAVNDCKVSEYKEFSELFMLTISSQEFRIITTIHLNCDEMSMEYVAQKTSATSGSITKERFYDYIGELGNTLCGSLKRSLTSFVPSLGMSTPNRLERDCMHYMTLQEPNYASFNHVEVNGQKLFECGIYICADTDLNIDVKTSTCSKSDNVGEGEEVDSGDLEFF